MTVCSNKLLEQDWSCPSGLSLQCWRSCCWSEIGAVDVVVSEPLVIVGQTDKKKEISDIRQTSDHKNEFK